MATITNFQVDSRASHIDIVEPYNPLTRVTDMSTLASPNENTTIEFTLPAEAGGGSVFMSYEQLLSANVANRIAAQASKITGLYEELKADVAVVYALTNAATAPHTYADYKAAVTAARNIRAIRGLN